VGTELSASSWSDEFIIAATGAEVRRASEWLDKACRQRSVPQELVERLALCLNEALTNVIVHGGRTALSSPIQLLLEVELDPGGGKVGVTASDAGIAFNPLSVSKKTLPKTLEEASAGGLGLVMIRRFSDWLDYRHGDGRNHLTFGMRWNPAMRPSATARFRRGSDRRIAQSPVAEEQRLGSRRDPGIQWIALFRDADPGELDEALADCEVLLLPAGQALLRPGGHNQNVFILLSGKLTAYLGEDASPDTAIEILPSECIGELSAIDGKPISALVLAASDARVLRLDKDVFWKRLIKLRGVAENLMTTLTERMRRANEKALAVQRERLELKHLKKELEIARQLQAGMVPLQRPLFPGRSDIEACGFMEPASKVGGDLFDAFFVDGRTLFICIGDVSGHGIAAALFMVRVIGLLRTLAMDTMQPEKILEMLNDRLCIRNDANLFVTLFCGFLDVQSGAFVYSNGGHCAPMLCTGRDGTLLPLPKGMLVGAASGRRYASLRRKLEVGETLLCYTDGVTEAEDPAGAQFSEQACLELLRRGATSPLPVLLDSLYEKVVAHTGSKLLADDCTMLAVRRPAP
jgi:sigma-B regulation protein RsbU (phosphoserine phosphatase)